MVKNQIGGKHKHQAKKIMVDSSKSMKFVISTDPNEIYAIITKKYGNNIFEVHCIDDKIRLCIVRGKFRGRHKKSNFVNIGSWVLIGLREWETQKENQKTKCDLLELYSMSDVDRLQKTISANWKILINNDLSKIEKSGEEDDNIIFTHDVEEQIIPSQPITLTISEETDESWIDFDAI
jgi:initiation factor 1A